MFVSYRLMSPYPRWAPMRYKWAQVRDRVEDMSDGVTNQRQDAKMRSHVRVRVRVRVRLGLGLKTSALKHEQAVLIH